MLFVRLLDFSLYLFSIGTSHGIPYLLSKYIIHKPPASIRDITVYKYCFCHSKFVTNGTKESFVEAMRFWFAS